jgi:hypothetical protein
MSLEGLQQGIMALVFIGVIGAIGAIVLTDFAADLTADSYAANVTTQGLTGVANATSYLSTIGTVLGVSAIIAIVVGAFYFFRK